MYIKEIYVEDANAPEFIQAMNLLEANIPCFVEHLGDNLIRIECRREDAGAVERSFAEFV